MFEAIFTKHYGEKEIFSRYSFKLNGNEKVAITGPSGIGKTTLLRLICGLERNEENGGNPFGKLRYSYLFQEDRLIDGYDAKRNIMLTAAKEFSQSDVEKAMAELSLEDSKNPVLSFSGGMRRRVALLRALLAPFDVLLLDEPFKGLDEDVRKKACALTLRMAKDRPIILVSHDKDDVEELRVDRVVALP